MRRLPGLLIIVAALALALLPLPHALVESWYSVRIYSRIQRVLTPLANLVPFALFDWIVLTVVALVILVGWVAVRQARRDRSWRPLGDGVWRLAVAGATVYLVFMVVWGFNYRRTSMRDRVVLEPGRPTTSDVLALGRTAAERLNALHDAAHATGWTGNDWRDAAFRGAFASTVLQLSDAPVAAPGRLKWTVFGPYFRWTGVDGMVDPFALEVLANPDLLPWERPFVSAHEWSHLAGFADESEANFVGWLTCLAGDDAAQYSGWLYLFWQVTGEVGSDERTELVRALAPGPRRDIDAIVTRLRNGQLPMLRDASWVVYDQYLRANRVEEGIRSYGLVVTLILRTRFLDGYRPVRQGAAVPAP